MFRFLVALALLALCIAVSAQEWVERDDVEYNCSTINAIIADYGQHDLARVEGRAASVKSMFKLIFPFCPAADAARSESAEADAGDETSGRAAVPSQDGRFSFASDSDGQQPVLGPIALPAGLYQFTLVAVDTIQVEPIPMSDDCGRDFKYGAMSSTRGKATSGIQKLYNAPADCDLIIQVKYTRSDWTLDIERVDPDRAPVMEIGADAVTFSSDEAGYQPVLGPITIAAGTYTVTATSDKFFDVMQYPLSSSCGLDSDMPILFLDPEEAAASAETVIEVESDCIVLLDVGGLMDNWTMVFEMAS